METTLTGHRPMQTPSATGDPETIVADPQKKQKFKFYMEDWWMLATLGILVFLQFVYIPLSQSGRLSTKGYALLGMALIAVATISIFALVIWTMIQSLRKRLSVFATFRLFGLAALTSMWLFFLLPNLWTESNAIAREHFDDVAKTNEELAMGRLYSISDIQQQFANDTLLDTNENQVGEFATLTTLAEHQISIPGLQAIEGDRTWCSENYTFLLYVPKDTTQAEHAWCAYAWPRSYGQSGSYSFFLYNNHGTLELYGIDADHFSGDRAQDGPASYDAFFPGTEPGQPVDPRAMKQSMFSETIGNKHWERITK